MGPVRRLASVSDRALGRIIKGGILLLVLGIPIFAFFYVREEVVPQGQSLVNKQIADAEQAVRANPNKISLRLTLADAYLTAHRDQDALNQYDEILKVDRGEPAALLGRGDILLGEGKLSDANAAYAALVAEAVGSKGGEFAAADPNLEHAYYGLGEVAVKQSRFADAVKSLTSAIGIDSSDADAWYLLGVASLDAGHPGDAVKALRQAVLFVPTGWCDPYATMRDAYTKLGDAPRAQYAGAMLEFCDKQPDLAKQQLTPLVATQAVRVDAMLGLGTIAESQGDNSTAKSWYQKVLAVDPDNWNATTGLARLGSPPPSVSPKPGSV